MKLIHTTTMTILTVVIWTLAAGCAFFDFDRNGKIDPITYLENAKITVVWVDEQGNAYNLDILDLGKEALYTYIEVKTGYRFELAEQQDGTMGIKIRDPEGYEIYIVPQSNPVDL